MSEPEQAFIVFMLKQTHIHKYKRLLLLTRGGDPALLPAVHSDLCWWGLVSWWHPLRPQRWICLQSRPSTGCVGASPEPDPRESAGVNRLVAPAERDHWPHGWRHCRGREIERERERAGAGSILRGGEYESHNLQQAKCYCKIDVQRRDVDYLVGYYFVKTSILFFLLHVTLAKFIFINDSLLVISLQTQAFYKPLPETS